MTQQAKTKSTYIYVALLILATIFWGGNFVIAKAPVETIGSAWMVGLRFFSAGIITGIVFFPRLRKKINKDLIISGCLIGVFSFLGYWTQFFGLEGTTPAKNAFLSTCYCITVPFLWWIVTRKRPSKRNLVAALICVAGLGLVTLQNDFSISWGDGMSMLSAVMYGSEIVAIALFLRDNDPLCIAIIQMIVCGLLGGLLGFVTTGLPSAQVLMQPSMLIPLAYTIFLGSCFGVTIQNFAQLHIPPAQVSLLFALESVFGTIFSALFWGEQLSAQILIGFALIFVAVLISQITPKKGQKKPPSE